MTRHGFRFLLFSVEPDYVQAAVHAGVDALVVDWEHIGKELRQAGADTQVNHDTSDDLRRVRAVVDRSATTAWARSRVVCRLNGYGPHTPAEVEEAVAAGADELLLPMVREPAEVVATLRLTRDRVGVGILVETVAALEHVADFRRLPLSRVYVGLNDLAIERRTPNIFTAVTDGTVERLRYAFDVPFGFGGLTLPDSGYPIPCRLLIGEMARLDCDFTFLRRSFRADVQRADLPSSVESIRAAVTLAAKRTPEVVAAEHTALVAEVNRWRVDVEPVGMPT